MERRAGESHGPVLWSVHRGGDAAGDAAAERTADLVRRSIGCGPAAYRPAGRWLPVVCGDTGDVSRGAGQDCRSGQAGGAPFGTGHLLFARLDDSYEKALDAATETLSVRYAMDFRKPAMRYCALGTPQLVAERIRAFHAAGLRHVILDLLGP